MDDIVGIITQFAKYLSDLISYIMSFLNGFNKKKEEATEDADEA